VNSERIAELRKEVVENAFNDEAFSEEVVSECLDEIERLQKNIENAIHVIEQQPKGYSDRNHLLVILRLQ
jgi:hypothetical protein